MRADWIEVKLGDVCKINPQKPVGDDNLIVSFLAMASVLAESGVYNQEVQKKYGDVKKGYTGFVEGDVIFAKITPCMENGKVALLSKLHNQIGFGSTEFHVIRPSELLHGKYLFSFIVQRGFRSEAQRSMTGSAGQLRVPKSFLEDKLIPLPPLPEQRAIVAKIEQLFSDLDNGIANLTCAKEKLTIYRQALLKKAFEGSQNVPFSELIYASQNGISKRKGKEGVLTKVLRLADISKLTINHTSPRHIMLTDQEIKKYQLFENDLIAIRVNGSKDLVGQLIYVTKTNELEKWGFCDHFIRFSLNKKRCNSKFYYYYFQIAEIRKYIHENMVSSAGQNTVSQGTMSQILVPLVELSKQNRIVQELESRLSVCDKLAESIDTSLQQAEALRQSILKRAFEGNLLTATELTACRKEPDWEPAENLIDNC